MVYFFALQVGLEPTTHGLGLMGGLEPPLTLINLDEYTADYCQVQVSYSFLSLTLYLLSYISLLFFEIVFSHYYTVRCSNQLSY